MALHDAILIVLVVALWIDAGRCHWQLILLLDPVASPRDKLELLRLPVLYWLFLAVWPGIHLWRLVNRLRAPPLGSRRRRPGEPVP